MKLEASEVEVGQTIYHKRFGKVIVAEKQNDGCNDIFDVELEDGSIKKLLVKYAPLQLTPDFEEKEIRQTLPSVENEQIIPVFGGGTFFGDYIQQGCSNRHLEARHNSEKLTAGEMAKLVGKELKRKVLASEIQDFATEWHHAGVFKKSNGKTGGKKVYWFNLSEKDSLVERFAKYCRASAISCATAN